jgi:hypothetical protein
MIYKTRPTKHGLVAGLGNGGLNALAAQVSPGPGAGVCLVTQHPPRAPAGDLEPLHERAEGQGIVALPGAGHGGQRPAPRIGEQVNLAGQPPARAA